MVNANGKNRFRDMTQGAEWKCILLFALPIMLSQFLQHLYNTVDGIIVGNFVSTAAYAGVSQCAIIANLFIAVSIGMANGSGVVISQMFGAGRREDMRRAAGTAVTLLAAMGAAALLTVFFSAEFSIATILDNHEPTIRAEAIVYLRIYALGLLFTFLYNVIAAILRSVGDSRALLFFLLISTAVNIVLDLLFVAVLGLGVAGAAWATVISQFVCAAVSIWYMYRNYEGFRFRIPDLRPDREKLRLCMKMGLPITAQQLAVTFGHLFLQRLINGFGKITMEAWAVGHRYDQYLSIPPGGMMQGLASFSGQNTGAGRYDRVKRGLISAVLMSVAIVVCLGVILYSLAEPLSMLFGNLAPESLRQAVECLRFLAFCYPVFALYLPFIGMYQGVGDPMASTVTSVLALTLRVSGAYVLVYAFGWGYKAIWTPYLLGWGSALIFDVIYFLGGRWKNKSLVKNQREKTA